ncbi:MAG: NAD(+)/NADH kinase [Gammaproteobacteria bacterium]|nr:NAD(+)/NADH kinase [Gammaproteobacteria bacterium]
MVSRIRTCALAANFADARVAESIAALLPLLRERGLSVLTLDDPSRGRPPADVTVVGTERLLAETELMIAVGGDGTLLHAARQVASRDIPLLGVNRGRLGFLTDVLPSDMAPSLDAVLAGQCQADRRPLLRARLWDPSGLEHSELALNDVVVLRRESGRLLDFETSVDGRYLNSHSGDGLVVATATGSTAYALSCGGPIIEPRLNVLVLAPVAPHTLSDRPILVPGDSTIGIRTSPQSDGVAGVTCDATLLGELSPGARLVVEPAGRSITLLHPPGYDYYRLLRSKLHWGRGAIAHER